MAIVKVKGISKLYKRHKGFFKKEKILALKNLSLEVKKGEVFGLLGLNAAGKSTLLKILLGLIFPSEGEYEILGKKGENTTTKQKIGFLSEEPRLYPYLSAEEFLDFCGKLFKIERKERKKRIKNLLEIVDLLNAQKIRLKEFSKGMIQRLGIASALINNPQIIFLDEPLGGLDPLGRKRIKNIILELKRREKTIFFSSHILAEVEEICNRIGILHKGRLISLKEISELKKEGESLEDFFLKTIKRENIKE